MCANKLMIAESDPEYCWALAKAISNINNGFEIHVKKLESKTEFKDYDLILTEGYSEEFLKNMIQDPSSFEYFVILTEDRTEDLKHQSQCDDERFWRIFKYQDLELIMSDLKFIISSVTGRKKIYRNDIETSLIGFFGSCGGAGRSVMAIATSKELVHHHNKRVLYLSFEEISATERYFGRDSGTRNSSDYLYFLLDKKNESICSHIDSFLCKDEYGVETLLPSEGRNDLSLLGQDELERFIQSISGTKRYDYIIMDLKNDLAEQTLRLVDMCSRLVVVRSSDAISKFKTEKMFRFMETTGALDRHQDHILVTNRSSDNAAVDSLQNDEKEILPKSPHHISVEEDRNSFRFRGERIEIDICRSLGLGIKRIAEEILIPKVKGG
jgi:cellulose biosynthesis protein BcsQ